MIDHLFKAAPRPIRLHMSHYVPHLSGDILEVDDQGLINSENKRDKLYVFFKVDMKKNNLTEETNDMVKMLFGC